MATITKSDRTKIAGLFFIIGIIGIVGIIAYPTVPTFEDQVISNAPSAPRGEPREREAPAAPADPAAPAAPADPAAPANPSREEPALVQISDDHPQAELLLSTIDEFHSAFESRDSRMTLNYYINDKSTYAEWSGQAGAFAGTYKGFSNIRILISTILGNTLDIEIEMVSYEVTYAGDEATVVSQLANTGHGKLIGEFSMEVDAVTKWEFSDGEWRIIDDRWLFTFFKTEVVAEGTVFPLKWDKIGDFSILKNNVLFRDEIKYVAIP